LIGIEGIRCGDYAEGSNDGESLGILEATAARGIKKRRRRVRGNSEARDAKK